MKKYEAILILDDRKVEGNGNAFVKDMEPVFKEFGATTFDAESMGRKQFAYPIKKKTAGTYWNIFFDLEEDKIEELKARYRLAQPVLRFTVFVDDAPEVTVIERKNEASA